MAYVYLHSKPNGEIFYVGKGNGRRAWAKAQRSEYWKRTVAKYGYQVSIFLDDVSDEKALSVEKDLIDAIGLDNLVNFTKGGEGILGYNHSEEAKKKIGLANRGGTSWSKGKKLSEEHRNKIKLSNKGRTFSKEHREKISKSNKNKLPWNTGKKRSDKTKKKISENSAQKVKLIDTITGVEYNSITEYCKKNNVSQTTFYYNTKGKNKTNKYKHIKFL